MGSKLKSAVELLLHVLTAVFGTAIFATAIEQFYRVPDLPHLVFGEYVVSVTVAAILGFLGQKLRRTPVAVWTWVVPAAWLLIVALAQSNRTGASGSVLAADRSVWGIVFGRTCGLGERIDCRIWILTAIPFVRSVAYSIGVALFRMTERRMPLSG